MKQIVKRGVPPWLRRRLSGMAPRAAALVKRDIVWEKTKAFGNFYVNGVYLNDRRFNGPVNDSEAKELTETICRLFNETEEAKEHHLNARPYRCQHAGARFQALLPDVWIDHPDTVFFDQGMSPFMEPNGDYGPLRSFASITRDMFTGIKGRHPICCVDPATAERQEEGDPSDLTLVYRLVDRIMS